MNVFELRDKLISDYRSYVKGFIKIKDPAIKNLVESEMDSGLLWPDPLIQLSPSFAPGGSIDDLVNDGILHPQCCEIFRIGKDEDNPGTQMRLHRHQRDAIQRAAQDDNYVLTTGTGSGKSLAYIIPIVNYILKTGSGKGIKAIIIYPMNALANSQEKELYKFINLGLPEDTQRVTYNRYTGQESEAEKRAICQNPPDILLTNYVMLEMILTRPNEAPLVDACRNLKFLVLDELHTYRGRQGADVAMLIRRTINATQAQDVIRVGTSATLSSASDPFQQSQEIARVATLLFGSEVKPENVIGETLQRLTLKFDFDNPKVIAQLKSSVTNIQNQNSLSFDELKSNAFFSWIETNFGVDFYPNTDILKRAEAKSISGSEGVAAKLSQLTGIDSATCEAAIKHALMLGYQTKNPANGFPAFAFKVHQFISRGDAVYASLDAGEDRYLTVQRQVFVPDSNKEKILLPLVFCRNCGQEYYIVYKEMDDDMGIERLKPRDLGEILSGEGSEPGYLIPDDEHIWNDKAADNASRVPDEWKDQDDKIIRNFLAHVPKPLTVTLAGAVGNSGRRMLFLKAPFRFCPHCQISYASNQRSDFAKLTALGTEGRSTATTILSLSAVRHIREMDLPEEAQKLLSFTDNRQDASLQSGHFNDFVQVGLLRGALYRALKDRSPDGVRHDKLTQLLFDSLDLDIQEYASSEKPPKGDDAVMRTERALRDVLGYHFYRDLRRGWRVTAPNLEQTGLLQIEYASLADLAADEKQWANSHTAIAKADPTTRETILKTLLDWMRKELAISVKYLDLREQESIVELSRQRLKPPWGFDENEQTKLLTHSTVLYPCSRPKRDYGGNIYLSSLGGFGRYLRRSTTIPSYRKELGTADAQQIIQNLLEGLLEYGIIDKVKDSKNHDVPGYQINADALIWKAGDGTQGVHDPIRQPSKSEVGQPVNEFFKEFYQSVSNSIKGFHSREHTAQVSYGERENRERAFRTAELPILYCSPTMELGIDISQLNMVNMRNAPPTPANYAQRSGRAGRSGQPALVFTYCSTGSPHDQYFFKRPQKMVSGSVATPQIDLANEDMLRAHVHAIWLSESKIRLGNTLTEVIDASGESPTLELLPDIKAAISDNSVRSRASVRAKQVIDTIEAHLKDSAWYTQDWLRDVFKQLNASFEEACERWRGLYRAALRQQEVQNRIILDSSRSPADRNQATRLRHEAESQLKLLDASGAAIQSDFYSYRYFASEGFLPGYNFPRLPLSAFIPGRRMGRGNNEYLSRPRFLAITEFGPRALIYHEGSKYIINQVIMPAQTEDNTVPTSQAKLCPVCGYLHTGDMSIANVCDHCGQELGAPIPNLFRLQNVVAKRKDQINCDEEERLKLGYEVRSAIRFTSRSGQLASIKTQVMKGDDCIANLTYGDSATIWRINLGYKKRKLGESGGFLLNTERGYWMRREDEDEDDDSPTCKPNARVHPYVSDTKNCLLFEPNIYLSIKEIASLQYALKNAIQIVFELEDNELAAEPLPDKGNRKSILFYEATEGGAGVLKRIINQKEFHEVIKSAIDLCHYDLKDFTDLKKAPGAKENCEAACYDCLMSYTNQTDHELLDRKEIINILVDLLHSELHRSSSDLSRQQHYQQLLDSCESDFEKKWLTYIYNHDYILPTHAQKYIELCNTRPDFLYEGRGLYVAIYVDGSPHDKAAQQEKDKQITADLENHGWHVIRFGTREDKWDEIIQNNKSVFGDN